MGIFERFERRVEGAVNGVFARAFKGDVQPVEIAARLTKELDGQSKLLSRTSKLVPNEFAIGLSAHDYDKLAPYSTTMSAQWAADLKSHAAAMGYVFNGPIRIHLDLDESLPTGRFTVDSDPGRHDDQPAGPSASRGRTGGSEGDTTVTRTSTRLVLEVNGTRHPLQPPGLVIGRGTEADVRISDPGISRRHAHVRVSGGDGRLSVDIVDLGSTNGIRVDGRRVEAAELRDGSRIEIGSTRLLVHAPAGR